MTGIALVQQTHPTQAHTYRCPEAKHNVTVSLNCAPEPIEALCPPP